MLKPEKALTNVLPILIVALLTCFSRYCLAYDVPEVGPEKCVANCGEGGGGSESESNGWRRVDARMAQQMASAGHPAVAVWKNPNTVEPGHIAIIRPGSLPISAKGVAIAQSGRYVLDARHLDAGFSDPKMRKSVQYWYHE